MTTGSLEEELSEASSLLSLPPVWCGRLDELEAGICIC